jgi:hypothetical protein
MAGLAVQGFLRVGEGLKEDYRLTLVGNIKQKLLREAYQHRLRLSHIHMLGVI